MVSWVKNNMSSSIDSNKTKALFLDRDGIINVDHGYVYKQESFEFKKGIFQLCQQAQKKGYIIIVITNQSGIARGYYSEQDFLLLTEWMTDEFMKRGVTISDTFYCPHHPKVKQEGNDLDKYRKECDCRKPKAGLIFSAEKKHHLNLTESIFIGDKYSDMEAAKVATIPTRLLINSQYLAQSSNVKVENQNFSTQIFENLEQAILFI